MAIIAGYSAISYWRTPPIIRDAVLSSELINLLRQQGHSDELPPTQMPRNASNATQQVCAHLCTDLKGAPLPVDVLVDTGGAYTNHFVCQRPLKQRIPRSFIHDLGGGLYVASPSLALLQVMPNLELPQRLALIDEFCGLFSTFKPTARAQAVLDVLMAEQAFPLGLTATACYDKDGCFAPVTDYYGNDLPWKPALNRQNSLTDLWKRPPLLRAYQFRENTSALSSFKGSRPAQQAASLAIDGSGSPLETRFVLIASLPPRYGGEHWPKPLLNKRIEFSPQAKQLSGMRSCVGDAVWEKQKVIAEVNGMEFHADRQGFMLQSNRTAALQSMGYQVIDITFQQMSDPEHLDTMLSIFSNALGFKLQKRTRAFTQQRAWLHRLLFGQPLP